MKHPSTQGPVQSTVCIVDDSEDMRDVLAHLMGAFGLTPEVYDSAEAFLRRGDGSEIRCLLLDLRLGGMSGLELLKQLSRNGLTYPVFLISGDHDMHTVAQANRHGAIVVHKPFDVHLLARDVLRSIGEART